MMSFILLAALGGPLRIHYLAEGSGLQTSGCEFYLGPASDRRRHLILVSEGGRAAARVRIDGKNLDLPIVSPNEDNDWAGPNGHVTNLVYRDGDVTVRIRRTVVGGCWGIKDDCEYSKMSAVITFIKGGRSRTLHAAGACGS